MKVSEVAQSCLTLCDPMDCSPPGSSVCGVLQARILVGYQFLLQHRHTDTHTHTHTVEYYLAIKNEILPFAVTWMDLENIILSETSDKDKYCVTTYVWNLKNTTN